MPAASTSIGNNIRMKQALPEVQETHQSTTHQSAQANEPVRLLAGLKSLTDPRENVRGVLLDQFGVLHDGSKPYPDARDAVQQLHLHGIKVVILSGLVAQEKAAA